MTAPRVVLIEDADGRTVEVWGPYYSVASVMLVVNREATVMRERLQSEEDVFAGRSGRPPTTVEVLPVRQPGLREVGVSGGPASAQVWGSVRAVTAHRSADEHP